MFETILSWLQEPECSPKNNVSKRNDIKINRTKSSDEMVNTSYCELKQENKRAAEKTKHEFKDFSSHVGKKKAENKDLQNKTLYNSKNRNSENK